jgi:hypothetical protein
MLEGKAWTQVLYPHRCREILLKKGAIFPWQAFGYIYLIYLSWLKTTLQAEVAIILLYPKINGRGKFDMLFGYFSVNWRGELHPYPTLSFALPRINPIYLKVWLYFQFIDKTSG